MEKKNVFVKIKDFFVANKGVGIAFICVVLVTIASNACWIVYTVNNNSQIEEEKNENINLNDVSDSVENVIEIKTEDIKYLETTEVVKEDGTTEIRNKDGIVVAIKDINGRISLTKDGIKKLIEWKNKNAKTVANNNESVKKSDSKSKDSNVKIQYVYIEKEPDLGPRVEGNTNYGHWVYKQEYVDNGYYETVDTGDWDTFNYVQCYYCGEKLGFDPKKCSHDETDCMLYDHFYYAHTDIDGVEIETSKCDFSWHTDIVTVTEEVWVPVIELEEHKYWVWDD